MTDATGTRAALTSSATFSTPLVTTTATNTAWWFEPPLTEQLIDAFCRLHNSAVALREAWS